MANFIYLPVDSPDLLEHFATPMAAGNGATILRVVDRQMTKAFRRVFGTKHLSRITMADTLFVIMHGTGDFEIVSTHAAGVRTADGRAIARSGIAEATGSRAALVFYRCSTCTRVNREAGPCEHCPATAPRPLAWNPTGDVYWCATHKTTSSVASTTCQECVRVFGPGQHRMVAIPQAKLAVYHKLYTPAYLARNLESEGLSKRANDVHIFSCGSGTSVGAETSFAEKFYEALVARGYGNVRVTGYRGEVSVMNVGTDRGTLLITASRELRKVPMVPMRDIVQYGPPGATRARR